MNKTYFVSWTIEVDAESPEDAALQAHGIMLDPESLATVFQVTKDYVTTTIDTEGGVAVVY